MGTLDLTAETFDSVVTDNDIVLIDFWAAWCGPCRTFAPIYESVAASHPDLVFGKVDTEAQPELAGSFGIRSIPTLVVIRDGIVLFSQPGVLPEHALEDLVAQVRALDMDDVRRQLAEQQQASA